jgi:hypothetical protein
MKLYLNKLRYLMPFYYEIHRAATKIDSRDAQQLEFIAEVVGKFRIFVSKMRVVH